MQPSSIKPAVMVRMQTRMQEGLWRTVVAEVEARSGRAVAPDLALRHLAAALLPPGGFSLDALHAALDSLGAGAGAAELQGCSAAELQQRTLQVQQSSRAYTCTSWHCQVGCAPGGHCLTGEDAITRVAAVTPSDCI